MVSTPWKIWKSDWIIIPTIGENKKMFQTTNQYNHFIMNISWALRRVACSCRWTARAFSSAVLSLGCCDHCCREQPSAAFTCPAKRLWRESCRMVLWIYSGFILELWFGFISSYMDFHGLILDVYLALYGFLVDTICSCHCGWWWLAHGRYMPFLWSSSATRPQLTSAKETSS